MTASAPVRHGRAREDADRLAGTEPRDLAWPPPPRDRPRRGGRRPRSRVGGAHGVAVHRRVRPRRNLARRDDRLGQHASERRPRRSHAPRAAPPLARGSAPGLLDRQQRSFTWGVQIHPPPPTFGAPRGTRDAPLIDARLSGPRHGPHAPPRSELGTLVWPCARRSVAHWRRSEAVEEPAAAQEEQAQEADGDGDVAQAEGQAQLRGHRRGTPRTPAPGRWPPGPSPPPPPVACGAGAGRPVRRTSRYANGMSQPTISTTHPSVCQGCTKTRLRKKRVSTGTLPYQITRYCDQKKYIHMMDMANCSLATSWMAAGGMVASAPGVGADGEDRQQGKPRVERAHHEVAAEEPAVPLGVDGHHEVEAPQGQGQHPQEQHGRRPARCAVPALAPRRPVPDRGGGP